MNGRRVPETPHATALDDDPTATGLSPRLAAALAYSMWWVSGALLLAIEPSHGFVRFHARQALVGFGLIWMAGLLLWAGSLVLVFISPTASRVAGGLGASVWLAGVVLWVRCALAAARGERWPLPWIGKWASRPEPSSQSDGFLE